MRTIRLAVAIAYLWSVASPCWAQTSVCRVALSSVGFAVSDSSSSQADGAAAETPPPASTMPSSPNCARDGASEGSKYPTGGAFTVGVVSGLLLGLIGTGIAYFAQAEPKASVEETSQLASPCKEEFQDAYSKKARGKKRNAALWGGLLGALTVGIVLASQESE